MDEKIDRILFEDESMIRDYQVLSKTWSPKGKQKVVPTYGRHQGVKLLGTLDYQSGEVYCMAAKCYDANVFLSFLQQIMACYPGERLVIVLDNARIHHAKLIQPFLSEHANHLELVFLPPYSPNLNPIEGLWKWIKQSAIANVFFSSASEIKTAVFSFIKEINKTPLRIVDRLCVCM